MKKILLLAALFGLSIVIVPQVQADNCKGGSCQQQSQCSGGKCNKGKDCQKCSQDKKMECPIVGKLLTKAKFFLENAEKIGLSNSQIEQIKTIKMDAKKRAVMDEANMKVFMLDLSTHLKAEKIDTGSVHKLIDGASEGMKKSMKTGVDELAKLKDVLSPAQMSKAKAIWKEQEDKKY